MSKEHSFARFMKTSCNIKVLKKFERRVYCDNWKDQVMLPIATCNCTSASANLTRFDYEKALHKHLCGYLYPYPYSTNGISIQQNLDLRLHPRPKKDGWAHDFYIESGF